MQLGVILIYLALIIAWLFSRYLKQQRSNILPANMQVTGCINLPDKLRLYTVQIRGVDLCILTGRNQAQILQIKPASLNEAAQPSYGLNNQPAKMELIQ